MIRARIVAVIAGLLAVTLVPQAANAAVPVTPKAATPAAALTVQQWIAREQAAEAERERQLAAAGPIDDTELNRMLIQDLADYDEDADVRAAAAAVLQTNDPAEFLAFLDDALPIYRAAATERKKQVAKSNLLTVQRWAEAGGPIVRQRAAAALATKDDTKIADFVAIGHAAAVAADNQDVINAAEQAKTIKARVEQIVAAGGYEVKSAGQAALDTEDPVTIAAFYNTGYSAAAARDAAAQKQIEAALAARSKAVADLADLASRSAQAATARKTIIAESVTATQSLTVAANSMGLVNRYAKQADAIYTADLPIRKAGGATHTADLTRLRADACAEWGTTTRNANQVTAHAGVAQTAAETLVKTGLSHGVAWADVLQAQSGAGVAAKQAAETACHASEATEAAAKALDADHNATVDANNAVKYRQAAESEAAAATKLADQAEKLAAAAQAAEADAHKQRLRAEQDARDARDRLDDARTHYQRAIVQRDIARRQMAIAVSQQMVAYDAAKRAVDQQNVAVARGADAKAALDQVSAASTRFQGLINDSKTQIQRAQKAAAERNAKEVSYAAYAQDAIAKKGTAAGDEAARQAAIVWDQLPGARAAESAARTDANAAADAANVAGAAARRASAAAAAAQAEARAAAASAAAARRDADDAAVAANRAIKDAQQANEYARQAVNVSRAAIDRAAAAKADAEQTQAAATAATTEAATASFQSRVAGRAAIAARVASRLIADPAATVYDVAGDYGATDNDAAMAIDIANDALLIGAEQSAAAEQHAADADAAAVHAAEQAERAQDQVKPAFAAAKKAADEAARAVRASKVAIQAATQAAIESAAAVAAARDAAASASNAAAYAGAADDMAVQAGHDASVARQAAAAAAGYAKNAKDAADSAEKIADEIESSALSADKVTMAMQSMATQMKNIATDLHADVQKVAELAEAEKKARQTAWIKEWKDAADKWLDNADWLDDAPWLRDFLKGGAESLIGQLGGLWMVGLCAFGAPGNTPGNTPDSVEACDMLKDGMAQLIHNPGALIHLEQWKNGEYAKAIGMLTVDIATLKIPGLGKIGAGLDVLKDGLTVGVAKLLSGELLNGLKTFGSDLMKAALEKLGAINLSKLLELTIDLPNKLTFSLPEISALKSGITLKGFDSVENALRNLGDKTPIQMLEDLLRITCTGNSFAGGTPVVLADGSHRDIQRVRLGDLVLAVDPYTGMQRAEPVTALIRGVDRDLTDVTVRDEHDRMSVVHTTPGHPFWVPGDRAWVDAAVLRPGRALRTHEGSMRVVGVRTFAGRQPMFNLTVADLHTYQIVAGDSPVLVHNAGCDEWAAEFVIKNGGDVKTFVGPGGERFAMGPYRPNGPNTPVLDEPWFHHTVVLKDGKVFDQWHPAGISAEQYKRCFDYYEDIDFGF